MKKPTLYKLLSHAGTKFYLEILFCLITCSTIPANAVADSTSAATCGLTTVNLAGNTPSYGTGTCTIVSGTRDSLASLTNPPSTLNGTAGIAYNLGLKLTNSNCTAQDAVDVTFNNPVITTQPVAATTCSGQSQTFSVTATGTSLTYQWRKAGIDISGATSASYTIATVNVGNTGQYNVVVTSNGTNSVSSATVALLVRICFNSAANFALFSSNGAIDNVGTSSITGDIGTNVGAVTGFGAPSTVNGNTYIADGSTANAATDLQAAYIQLMAAPATNTTHAPAFGNGETLYPGVYATAAAGSVAGTLTLDAQGNSDALFIFTFGGAFTTGVASSVVLTNGATACNVYWVAEGAIAMAATTTIKGTFIANNAAISLAAGGQVEGRMFSTDGAIAVDQVTVAITTSCTGTFLWTGLVSTDWQTAGNWLGSTLPTNTTNITIPSGLSNYPILNSGTGTAKNIIIQNNASLTVTGATLKIMGSISNTGTFNAANGTIEMDGTTAQSIPAATFTADALKNLTINNNDGVTLEGALNLTDSLTIVNGSLAADGYLTLKSTATATARVANITSAAITPISGNVIVERYIPGRRKYRLITSSVTTHTNAILIPGQEASSIWGNWQNGGINTSPNIGSLITGGTGADGFDAGTANASLFTYDDVTRTYVGYTTANGKNTKYSPLNAGVAYFMFVYGDRLNSVFATNPHNTVLVETGLLKTGNQVYNTGSNIPLSGVTGRFTLLGNPFASPINWATIPKTNLENTYWGWDPNLSNLGGYITVTTTGSITLQAPYSGSTGLNQYIQPGQGFFVKTSGASPVLSIREQDKVSNFNGNAFFVRERVTNDLPLLAINLQYVSSGNSVLADGVLTAFDASFFNQAGAEDATKMANTGESIGILNDTTILSIDARNMPQNDDTLFLNTARLTKAQYSLQIFAQQMETATVLAYLQDRYLNTLQLLSLTDTNNITFNVTAGIPASSDLNRFRVVFKSSLVVLPLKFTSIKASEKSKGIQIDWQVVEEAGIKTYEIERSADGINFIKIAEVTAKGNNSNESYDWLDTNPITGNNYYRISAIQANGKFIRSKIVHAKIITNKDILKVYPNPVTNKQINIWLAKREKGKYSLLLHNQQGQQIMQRVINHTGGSFNQMIKLNKNLPAGNYYLQIAGNTEVYKLNIFIE